VQERTKTYNAARIVSVRAQGSKHVMTIAFPQTGAAGRNDLDRVHIVLCRPTHPGNIGAVARAMKTMRLSRLRLVAPERFPAPEATAMAAGAEDVLEAATVFDTLDEALRDCPLVVGTSARARRIGWPVMSPSEAAERILEDAGRGSAVALVFGQERTGLTNEELDRCRAVVSIPANPDYASINLAGAVQILTYELMQTVLEQKQKVDTADVHAPPPATSEQLDHLYRHLEQVLVQTGFLDPANPRLLMRRLRRLFNRAALDQNEINILRGILTSVERSRDKR
jgi:TrmH family RNA methyltransferase